MNAEVKAKWVKALRSGKFKQGQQAMYDRDNNTLCCLGVLCVVQEIDSLNHMGNGGQYGNVTPPRHLDAGLSNEDIYILLEANDSHEWTFEDIAAYVEAML